VGKLHPMQEQLITLLAGRRGHFQMESGYHSESWFDLNRLFRPENRAQLEPFTAELARRLAAHRIDAVCGPMTGGAKLAELIAAELGIAHFHADRFEPPNASGLFPIQYVIPETEREKLRDRSVAIVDDAISAGSAVRGTYSDLLTCGARPVALGALFIFGEAASHFAADHHLALEGIALMSFSLWKPADCPLCKAGTVLEKVSDAV